MAIEKINFEIYGVKELKARVATINYDIQYKSGRFALRKAANYIRDSAKMKALLIDNPMTGRQISENIAVRWSSRMWKENHNMGFRVGILGGARSRSLAAEKARRRRKGRSLEQLGEIAGKGAGNPGGNTWYWRFIEFGTERNPARPFLEPSLTNNTLQATAIFATEFNKAIDRAAKRAEKKFRSPS